MTDKKGQTGSQTASPYAGRWVARLRGKVIAQGKTPEEARRAAQTHRHKESPEIVFMPAPFSFSPLLASVHEALPAGQEIYLVGGAVRDALLGRESHDLDFAVPADGIKLARRIANKLKGAFYPLDNERDTGRVVLIHEDGTRTVMDFATYRGADIEADLRDRDFTINAIAYNLGTEAIFDPLNGANDLRAKRIQACTPESLTNDPVRVLRAVRLAAGLGFQIDAGTRQNMKQAAEGLRSVSPERLRDELFRILEGPQPGTAIRALEMLGVLPHILPELPALKGVEQPMPHVYDVWTHTLSAMNQLEDILAALSPGYDPEATDDLFTGLLVLRLGRYREQFAAHFANPLNVDRSARALLFFAALYHDVAKPACKTTDEDGRIRFWEHDIQGADMATMRANVLHLSNDEIHRLCLIIRHHMRVHFYSNRMEKEHKEPSRKAIYRFFRDVGEAGVDLALLAMADTRATHGHTLAQETWTATLDICRTLLENYWERPTETVYPPRLLNGNEVMTEFTLKPGPRVGEILEAIREAQATGKVHTREEALAFARVWLDGDSNRKSEI
ncbi:MAG: HD domain-containing protein [Anaerolineales bacterium]|nr:HD domain-containing protein [Anaerolineales bacterium]